MASLGQKVDTAARAAEALAESMDPNVAVAFYEAVIERFSENLSVLRDEAIKAAAREQAEADGGTAEPLADPTDDSVWVVAREEDGAEGHGWYVFETDAEEEGYVGFFDHEPTDDEIKGLASEYAYEPEEKPAEDGRNLTQTEEEEIKRREAGDPPEDEQNEPYDNDRGRSEEGR